MHRLEHAGFRQYAACAARASLAARNLAALFMPACYVILERQEARRESSFKWPILSAVSEKPNLVGGRYLGRGATRSRYGKPGLDGASGVWSDIGMGRPLVEQRTPRASLAFEPV